VETKELVEKFSHMLGDDRRLGEACARLAEIISEKHDAFLYITPGWAMETMKGEVDHGQAFQCLWALAASPLNILDVRYEFIDDEGNIEPLAAKDVAEAMKVHSLAHPITGELIYDYQDYVAIHFSPTKEKVQ